MSESLEQNESNSFLESVNTFKIELVCQISIVLSNISIFLSCTFGSTK